MIKYVIEMNVKEELEITKLKRLTVTVIDNNLGWKHLF